MMRGAGDVATVVFALAMLALAAYGSREMRRDCVARGGQVLEQPGRPGGCVLPRERVR